MLRATWRNLASHKLRLALTVLSVVLGVALVVGTLVFTDTLRKTFDDLFNETTADVVVTAQTEFEDDLNFDAGASTVPASVVETVQGVQGVDRAEGTVLINGVAVVGKDGKTVGSGFAPQYGANWSDDTELSPFRLVDGDAPRESGEVAVDTQTAGDADLEVGDTVEIVMPVGEPIEQTVAGIFSFGSSGNLAGASLVAFDTASAQDLLLDGRDAFTQVDAAIAEGETQEEVASRVQDAVGSTYVAKAGEEVAAEEAASVGEFVQFINIFLLVFAIIGLVVGAFIIFNTFSMLVAQRTRELALLRAVGARRKQVRRSVLLEALVVGVIGATVGILAGVLIASGIQALFTALGFLEINTSGLVLKGSTVVWAYVIGIVITVLAAYLPARRASKVPPVAAMRDDAVPAAKSLRVRTIVGLVLTIAGLALGFSSFSTSGGDAAQLVGLAALLLLVGILVLAPPLARPMVTVVGAPFRRLSPIPGKLALRNATRNPRRTAATASALIIMLGVVTAISVLASSTSASVGDSIDKVVKADLTIGTQTFTGFSPEVAEQLADVEGVAVVSPITQATVKADGGSFVTGVDPATIGEVAEYEFVEGGFDGLADGGVLVDSQQADGNGYEIGSPVEMTFIDGSTDTLEVVGIFDVSGFFSGYQVAQDVLDSNGYPRRDFTVFVKAEEGADLDEVRAGVEEVVAAYPQLQVQDQSQFKEQVRSNINQLLFLIYGLLVVAGIISALGIVNTLLLAVIERTREIGLLRAVGGLRGQIRRSITIESVVIALFGAVVGVAFGILCAWWLQRAVEEQGISVLAVPWIQVVAFLVIALVVGALAALWPARRGSRLDVLQAIATE